MEKILYIANSRDRYDEFKHVVDGFMETDFAEFYKPEKIHGYSLIIIKLNEDQPDFHVFFNNVRVDCAHRQIPLILSIDEDKISGLRAEFMDGISGLVSYPYNSNRVISLLKILLSLSEGISVPETQFLNAFIKSTVEVLQKITGQTVTHKGIYLKRKYKCLGDISGYIFINGTYNGVIELIFLESSIAEIVSRIIECDDFAKCDQDFRDGVGEIVNQVSGKLKGLLWDDGFHIDFSLPKMRGKASDPSGCLKADTPYYQLHFDFEGAPFILNLQLSSQMQTKPLSHP